MKINSFHVLYSMKTKFATLIAFFFLILSSHAEEPDVVHRYTAGADSFYRRTLSRIAEGWVGARENFRFALQSLKDKAVTAEREAKARARLTCDNIRTETARKSRQIANDTRETIVGTGEKIRNDVSTQIRKTGNSVKEHAEQGVRDVKNSDW